MNTVRERMAELRRRYEGLVQVYGRVAIGTYICLWAMALGGSILAVEMGFEPKGVTATAGTWVAAYAMHRLTWIPRILLTLVLTPIVARVLGRGPGPAPLPEEER